MNEKELAQFVKWLPSNVNEFKDKTPEEVVTILNKLSQTEEGMSTISELINQFKQNSTGMFKNGGKLDQLVRKYQRGNKMSANYVTNEIPINSNRGIQNREENGLIYTVQPGDSLSKISLKLTGNAYNYREISKHNNIENPNLILVGQKIIIPEKFTKPLKKEEIPTNNKTHIIDNYSPNYNYIVEGDKIYYSKKNRDHWVDISDNIIARKNLYNFLKEKYNFKGYDDNEHLVWNLIDKGKFNYSKYHNQNSEWDDNNSNTNESTYPSYLSHIQNFFNIPNYLLDKAKQKTENPEKSKNIEYLINEVAKKKSQLNKSSNTSDINTDKNSQQNAIVSNRSRIFDTDIQEIYKNLRKQSQKDTVSNEHKRSALDWWTLGKNYIERQFDKTFKSNESISVLHNSPDTTSSKFGIIPGSFVGDTIKIDNRQYIVPESLNLKDYVLGYRNRNNNTPIESEGAIITAFNAFKPYGLHDKNSKNYIGISKDGDFKAGDISNFRDGDFLSPTFKNIIYEFVKDKNGNLVWQSDVKHGNRSRNVPKVKVLDESTGQIKEGFPINILSSKNDLKGNTYGNINGGRVVVQTGNEIRLLSGSLQSIINEFENMKKRNHVDHGAFYTLDNGSFNRALRTYDKKITHEDLRKYDLQNVGNSGNFLYIIGNKPFKFKQDTLLSPNIRTTSDDSYKKGHPLKNSNEGVVFHYTAFENDPNMDKVTRHFMNPNTNVSAHVVINKNGDRRVFAHPDDVTFHSGSSYFNNRSNVNDFMHGIEFQGNTLKEPLTNEQIQSVVEYLTPLIRKYNIKLENLTTHQIVRNLYNKYRKQLDLGPKAPEKYDLSYDEYKRIIDALLNSVYYKK